MADETRKARSGLPRSLAELAGFVPGLVVWTTWAFMLAAALWFVMTCGKNVPFMDDWEIVPALSGAQPITANWLWSQHNEHRIPLPRLLLLGLFSVSGNDFRAGMFFNVFARWRAWPLP